LFVSDKSALLREEETAISCWGKTTISQSTVSNATSDCYGMTTLSALHLSLCRL